MITLIGTGHVFNLSNQILKIFDEKNPDIICVELDKQRYNAMMTKLSNPEEYEKAGKNLPVAYKLLARFQDNMADEYGVVAGSEMLTAINYAQTHQKPVAFIDMDAQHMFTKMLKTMKLSEKIKLMLTGLGGFFISKKRVEKELTNFENNFDNYIQQIGEKFPTIKRVLIDERNIYMVQQITEIKNKYEKIGVVLGDGHIPGISELLKEKNMDFETIRLSDLRSKVDTAKTDSTSASFTTEYKAL